MADLDRINPGNDINEGSIDRSNCGDSGNRDGNSCCLPRRRKTRRVMVGSVPVGGGAPVSVQSMTKTATTDTAATLTQVKQLVDAGCDIVRLGVPDTDSVRSFGRIAAQVSVPLVADIHFDYKLALAAMDEGAAKVRVNPGNLGGRDRLEEVAEKAQRHGVAIRIGVNAGSLPTDLRQAHGGVTPEAMVAAAERYLAWLDEMDFNDVIISLKTSDVLTTVAGCRLFADRFDVPQHLGITEAGSLLSGTIRSAAGLGILLYEGIGDTVRVSLSAPSEEEVRVGRELLRCLGLAEAGPIVISCPTCARVCIDVMDLCDQVEKLLLHSRLKVKVAIMGCAVNGPGEAGEADIALAGFNRDQAGLYRNGCLVKKVSVQEAAGELLAEIERLAGTTSRRQ